MTVIRPGGPPASTTDIVTSADLSISKSPVTDPIEAGALQTYVLQITNNGPSISRGVVVTDPLPAGVTLAVGGAFDRVHRRRAGRSAVRWATWAGRRRGTCRSPSSSIPASAGPGSPTPHPWRRRRRPEPPPLIRRDEQLLHSEPTRRDPIRSEPDQGHHQRADRGRIDGHYRVVATNNGPSDTTRMVLTDPLPTGTTLVTANASDGGSCQLADPVVCTWPSVVAGDTER